MTDVLPSIVWTLVCAAGGYYSHRNLLAAAEDRGWLAGSGLNGARKIVADGNVRRERARMVFWTIAVVVGIVTLAQPERDTWVRLAVAAALIFVMAVNAYNSYSDDQDRRKVRALDTQEAS